MKEETNLSERRPVDCKGCGKCCQEFETHYPAPDGTPDMDNFLSEMTRIKFLKGMHDKIEIRKLPDGSAWLVFKIPCDFLLPDNTCYIYNHPERPLLCRNFPYDSTTKDSCPRLK